MHLHTHMAGTFDDDPTKIKYFSFFKKIITIKFRIPERIALQHDDKLFSKMFYEILTPCLTTKLVEGKNSKFLNEICLFTILRASL
jgi:hypothetical protein